MYTNIKCRSGNQPTENISIMAKLREATKDLVSQRPDRNAMTCKKYVGKILSISAALCQDFMQGWNDMQQNCSQKGEFNTFILESVKRVELYNPTPHIYKSNPIILRFFQPPPRMWNH